MANDERNILNLLFAGIAFAFLVHLFYAVTLSPVFGDDAFNHLAWLEEFTRLRSDGINYPRWLQSTYGGIGSPTFYFYPPLCYFIADLFFSLDVLRSPTALFHAVNASALILSALTFFWYSRTKGVSRYYSALGALLYAAASYRYVDVYTRAALGEHVAFAWIPLVFLSIDQALRASSIPQRLLSLVTAAVGWSMLIITNIPSTVVTAVLVVPYTLLLFRREILLVWPAMAGALLAGVMCAFTILPLVEFKGLIQTGELYNLDIFSSQWHHVLIELFEEGPRKSAIQFNAFASAGIALLVSWKLLRSRNGQSKNVQAILSIAVASIFFQLPFVSDIIWDNFEPLQLLQFSWRFTIGIVFFTAVAIPWLLERQTKAGVMLLAPTVILSIFFYLRFGYLLLTYPIPQDVVEPVRRGAPEYVNKYVKLPKAELLLWARSIMDDPILSSDVRFRSEIAIDKADTLAGYFDADQPFSLHIKRLWWPQWRVEVLYATSDGEERFTGKSRPVEADSNGLIVVRGLNDSPARFLLTMEKSDAERTGEMLSLIGVGIFSVICLIGSTHTRRKTY